MVLYPEVIGIQLWECTTLNLPFGKTKFLEEIKCHHDWWKTILFYFFLGNIFIYTLKKKNRFTITYVKIKYVDNGKR